MPWDPTQYNQFEKERAAPFEDLLKLIRVRPGLKTIDLGCGSGALTERLANVLPDSDVLGIDASPEMLQAAQPKSRPGLRFEVRDIRDVDGSWDLIFSNAALQWVPGHGELIPRLFSLLSPEGQLVVQVPSNSAHVSHALMVEVAREAPFHTALGGWERGWATLPMDEYADLLYGSGAQDITVFEKVYPHVLADADSIVEWYRGTALVTYLERLPGDLHDRFVERYRARLWERYPSGPIFYGFRRILFAGASSAGHS